MSPVLLEQLNLETLTVSQLNQALILLSEEELAQLDELLEEQAAPASLPSIPLRNYIRQAWPVIEPTTDFIPNWHIDCMSEYLEAISNGQLTRVVFNLPPRNMKSITVSVMWPTWEWTRQPWTRWMFTSYSASLSTKHSIDRREIIRSRWYQVNWGNVFQLTDDQNQKTEYQNNRRGVMVATSTGGTATGKGGSRIVIDDPLNPELAESKLERETANRYFRQTLLNRLDDKRTGAIVIVMQRLHHRDVTAEAIDMGFEVVTLPAEATSVQKISFPTSGRIRTRQIGDILWPARDDKKVLTTMKLGMGTRTYSAQYQQQPSPEQGDLCKRSWWRHWTVGNLPAMADFDEVILSWDMAFAKTEDSSYVAGGCWGRMGANKYLLDQVRKRMDFVETIVAFVAMTEKWPRASAKLVENKANGPAVISTLKSKIPGLIGIEPEGSKESRAIAVTPDIEAGNVFLPPKDLYEWVEAYIEEWAQAPHGEFWDQIDQSSQALRRLQKQRGFMF